MARRNSLGCCDGALPQIDPRRPRDCSPAGPAPACESRPLARSAPALLLDGLLDYYLAHGRNVAQTCRHFDISRQTFYRWWQRYDPRRPLSLEDDCRTRRPQHVRQPQTPPVPEARIRTLLENPQRLVDPTEIVVQEVKCKRMVLW
ncbi:MAG: helix-turn-helix domain-containing protein [bacterium]